MSAGLAFVGQAVLDHVFRVPALPAGGGKCVAERYHVAAGGLAARAALSAERLRDPQRSPSVRLLSATGDDAAGAMLCRLLADGGLALEGVARVEGAYTSVSAVLVDAVGERQVVNHRGSVYATAALPAGKALEGCVAVQVDPRWPAAAAWALREARARGLLGQLDAELAPATVLRELVPLADWVVFSRDGLRAWAGSAEVHDDAALLSAAAAAPRAHCVVTMGADGALWCPPGGPIRRLPAMPVQALDTNGAGDTLHGALLLNLAEGLAPAPALRRAMAAAALACRGSIPTRAALDDFLEQAA